MNNKSYARSMFDQGRITDEEKVFIMKALFQTNHPHIRDRCDDDQLIERFDNIMHAVMSQDEFDFNYYAGWGDAELGASGYCRQECVAAKSYSSIMNQFCSLVMITKIAMYGDHKHGTMDIKIKTTNGMNKTQKHMAVR